MNLWHRHRRKIAALVLLLTPLILLSTKSGNQVGQEPSAPQRAGLASTATVGAVFRAPVVAVGAWLGGWLVDADVEAIRAENARLREEKIRLIGVLQENERLRRLVGFKAQRPELRLIPARVVARDTTAYFRVVTLKLSVEGKVEPRMPVISADGVVGQVHRVFSNYVEVILVSDPRHRVDAVTQRTRSQAVVEGLGHERDYHAKLAYLSEKDDVRPGDVVVTSGMGGVFPPELILGTVAHVDTRHRSLFQDVTLEPAVDASRLGEVFIVAGVE